MFRVICIGFSVVLLIGALLGSIELAEINEELTVLEQELKDLKEESRILKAEYETDMNLGELERYATQELGMQTLKPSQIFYIDLG